LAVLLAFSAFADEQQRETSRPEDQIARGTSPALSGDSNTTGYSDSSGNLDADSSGGSTAVDRVFETFAIEG